MNNSITVMSRTVKLQGPHPNPTTLYTPHSPTHPPTHPPTPTPTPTPIHPQQEFDSNRDRNISYEEFSRGLSRWIREKLALSGAGSGPGGAGSGAWSSLVDPAAGGPAAALLADLPASELAQLQVGAG
jgi:hypothetical protein